MIELAGAVPGAPGQSSCLHRVGNGLNLSTLEKQNDDYYLTKTILRSYGYGLSRKPLIFKPVKRPTERAQMGAAWRVSCNRRFAVPRTRAC